MATTREEITNHKSHLMESMGVRTLSAHRPQLSPLAKEKDVGRRPLREFGTIDVDRVIPDPNQPREEFDKASLERLAKSLTEKGQLSPIGVRWSAEHGKWMIVHGERRWRAACLAGHSKIECRFEEDDALLNQALERQLIENCLREDLKPIEEAKAFAQLMERNGWTGKQLAEELRIAPAKVSRALALLKLPEEIQSQVISESIPARTAYELSKLKPNGTQRDLAERAARGELTHGDVARVTRKRKSRNNSKSLRPRTKQTFYADEGWSVTVSADKRGTYHDIEAAIEQALEEVRHRINNGSQLF